MILIVDPTIPYNYQSLLNTIKNDLLVSNLYLNDSIYLQREHKNADYQPIIGYFYQEIPTTIDKEQLEKTTVKQFIDEMEKQ